MIAKQVNITFFREYCILLAYFRKTINTIGWEKIKTIDPAGALAPGEEVKEFCEVNNGQYAAEICNDFFSGFFTKHITSIAHQPHQLAFIGVQPERMQNSKKMMELFCNWLHFKFFSNTRIRLTGPRSGQYRI